MRGAIKKDLGIKSLVIISLICYVLCLALFLVQTAVQLSFCMLILKWLFASFQILSTGCMSSSQEFLGCTITKKVKEHWCRVLFVFLFRTRQDFKLCLTSD